MINNFKLVCSLILCDNTKTLNKFDCFYGILLFLGWKSRDSVPKLVNEYMEGKCKVDEFITHTKPLSEINEAFHLMHSGQR